MSTYNFELIDPVHCPILIKIEQIGRFVYLYLSNGRVDIVLDE